jgi:tetratricopeptide (TPR) repeat protein
LKQAKVAYEQAAELQEQSLYESPKDPDARVALANTLLNKATLMSPWFEADELEGLYRHVIELDRAALDARGDHPGYQAELALGLEDQGLLFLATGRGQMAHAAVNEALAIRRRLLAGGRMKGVIERYVARNYASKARVLAAAGRAEEAEQSYQQALQMQAQMLKEAPLYPYHRAELALTLVGLADLLRDTNRKSETVDIRRQVVGHYEVLKANFPEDRRKRGLLAASYLELVSLLWDLGRQGEAAEPYRKAFEVDPKDPGVNNELAWYLATCSEPRLRDAAEAVRFAEKAVRASPNSGSYWTTLGVARYRNGDDNAAIAALETAMSLRAGGDSYDWFFLAMAHGRLGNHDKAYGLFDRALQWMDKYMPQHRDLRRFRGEAEDLLTQAGKS